jgi:hypothetical protein
MDLGITPKSKQSVSLACEHSSEETEQACSYSSSIFSHPSSTEASANK